MTDELLEKLSELEHEQWMKWSKTVYNKMKSMKANGKSCDAIIAELRNKWKENWIPYSKLEEKTKEYDREWARKVLEVVKS